jgi:deoxyribose-phosphate aldolase
MKIEYSLYDVSLNEEDIKKNILQSLTFNIDQICVLPYYIKLAKLLSEGSKTIIATCVDFPLGIMDTKNRANAVEQAIRNGAQSIDLVIQTNPLTNRKYDKIRDDINTNLDLCLENKVNLRYLLDYRIFTYDTLYKISRILISYGICEICPSTGYFIDDINDNIIASAMINKKEPSINIICNGNIWNTNHINIVNKAKLYGLRVSSINGLELLTKNKN